MNNNLLRTRLALAIGMALASNSVFADGTRFSDFTPLSASAGPTTDESAPITLGNLNFNQVSIADRHTQMDAGKPNGTNELLNPAAWDMNTLNETGRYKGRFLFTVFEGDIAGIQRHDLRMGVTDTIWQSQSNHESFDPSFWTPWGTFITAEESWETVATGHTGPNGRLFEMKNPLTAPAILNPLTPASNDGANLVHQNVIPRTSHEGIQFDKEGNMYFIDELGLGGLEPDGGSIYKYVPKARMAKVLAGKADYFAAGQTFVLRVGDGNTPNATGAYNWVAITDENGAGLPGALTFVDPLNGGVTSVDARNTTNLAAFKGTGYQRPEDLQIQTIRDKEYLYVATTTTGEVYRLDLKAKTISVFANQSSIDLATGVAVGTALRSPDNLALDHDGNIYIVEDRNGGSDDDIWFAKDLNKDGDLLDAGEGIGRWASNGTPGSEFSGLYFDPFNKRRAWVNIQHPTSGNDRTIEITIPHEKNENEGDDE
ncbi:putative exosortase interaction domain-containing protein [Methyloglobulus morosus KoM1]|uniref:Putative exosortase interaction domain-containing protein n=1 Tax=Methyloglobulus morosus KoM1 TaxID=1116472 RepID=V5BFN6_9GAMM|nr:alkaline phosphatase PhoX [Methyloglobulus morosus]ESS72090.1 putative exosortase interaction domain-containing protein [Methyloglobulus morosus KoM1]